MTIKEIKEKANKYIGQYNIVAIRTQEEKFVLGNINHLSKEWVNGAETENKLDGISATNIKSDMVKMHSDEYDFRTGFYYGEHLAIVVGDNYTIGFDDGEVIIQDAIVVEILK